MKFSAIPSLRRTVEEIENIYKNKRNNTMKNIGLEQKLTTLFIFISTCFSNLTIILFDVDQSFSFKSLFLK